MRRKILNVRSVLEGIIDFEANYRNLPQNALVPAYDDYLRELAFLSRAILRKRDASGTRKDLYVEAK
jgi:hypothetical protein